MIIEPNPFHGEVIPGVIYYFNTLGYKVKLYIREELIKENLISNFTFNGETSIFDIKKVQEIFNSADLIEYDFCFFTSLEFQNEKNILTDFIKFNNLDIKTKYGVLGIYHTINFINIFGTRKLAEEGRIFCLSEFQRIMPSINVLNPHYFGDLYYASEEHVKTEKVGPINIAMLGNMYRSDIIAKAMKKLSKTDHRKIIIYHTGGKNQRKLKRIIKRKLKFIVFSFLAKINDKWETKVLETEIIEMGRLSFPELFDFLKKIDYLLIPLDYHTYDGMHYISVSTSGSKQISLGMNIPVICNEVIGFQYGFDSDSSVLYTENNLEEALKEILSADRNKYNKIKKNLREIARQTEKISLENLKNTISKFTK